VGLAIEHAVGPFVVVIVDRLEKVRGAGSVEWIVGLLAVDRGPCQIAFGQPRRKLVADDRVHGRQPDVDLASAVMSGPIHRARGNLRLEHRRHRHRVPRHPAQAVVELRRVQSRQLHHRQVDSAAAMPQFAAQGLERALDRVLGAAVRGLQGNPSVRERRADLHNRPAVTRQHPLERRLRPPHSAEVRHPRRPFVFACRDVLEEVEHGRHRVVDPYVDRAEPLLDRRGRAVDGVELGDVRKVHRRDAAEV